MLGTLVQGRVCVGGAAINAAKVALAIAIEYAAPPPAVRQPGLRTRRRCCSTTACTSGGCSRCWPAPTRCTSPRSGSPPTCTRCSPTSRDEGAAELARRALESRAAGTKALGTWHASRTIQECREACGGAGYLSVNRFDALRADTDVFTTFEGDNTILMQLVAKGLLTDYKDSFEDLDQIGLVRFVASTAVETVLERTNARSILERLRDVVPGRRPERRRTDAGPARRRLPAGDADLARGAHAVLGGPPAQERHGRRAGPGRGVQPAARTT